MYFESKRYVDFTFWNLTRHLEKVAVAGLGERPGGGGADHLPPYFRVKEEEMTEGRKAGWASKLRPGSLLISKCGSATESKRFFFVIVYYLQVIETFCFVLFRFASASKYNNCLHQTWRHRSFHVYNACPGNHYMEKRENKPREQWPRSRDAITDWKWPHFEKPFIYCYHRRRFTRKIYMYVERRTWCDATNFYHWK